MVASGSRQVLHQAEQTARKGSAAVVGAAGHAYHGAENVAAMGAHQSQHMLSGAEHGVRQVAAGSRAAAEGAYHTAERRATLVTKYVAGAAVAVGHALPSPSPAAPAVPMHRDTDLLRKVFDRIDVDSSGFITPQNLHDEMRRFLGTDYDNRQVGRMLAAADFKHDGRISFEEFKRFMETGATATEESLA